MVLSGFSGRATQLLAKTLAIRGEEFGRQFMKRVEFRSCYLVQYDNTDTKPSRDLLFNPGGAAEIMPCHEAIETHCGDNRRHKISSSRDQLTSLLFSLGQ